MGDNNQISHIGIVIDGNRRYAKEHGLPTFKGHQKGAEKVEDFLKWCKESNIKEVSIYCLSAENLKRNKEALSNLFSIFKLFFKKFIKDKKIHEDKVKISFIGDLSLVPKDIRELAEEMQENTKNYNNYKINFCFAYGGRLELVHAFNKLRKENPTKEITEKDITNALWLKSEPQLVIRTGDAVRTSNFLPWQTTYSEWIFLNKMWPEFTKQDLIDCIENFNSRKRNFGK